MRSAERVRNRKRRESLVQVIASNDDLLTELLLRLPIKSLLKFKCVCKQWLSIITDPQFTRRKYLRSNAISALCFFSYSNHNCKFIHLDGLHRTDLNFADCPLALKIVQSCNGFLLCGRGFLGDKYFVCNPTTKQLKALPPIGAEKSVLGVNLAFDPSLSQSYKVVCIHGSRTSRSGCQILIYSSETRHWRACGVPFTAPLYTQFHIGATYWNGVIHWVTWSSTSLYFDVNEELLREMAMPPSRIANDDQRGAVPYFGESGGHLHLVDFYKNLITQFIVYEMESDHSGWFVKFVVDFNWLAWLDPQCYRIGLSKQPSFNVLCVVRGEKEEDSYLVLHSNENKEVIRYNFIRQTHQKIGHIWTNLLFGWITTFQCIENLSLL